MKCPRCGTEFTGEKCPVCGYEPTEYERAIDSLMNLAGIGKKRAEELYRAGYKDIESIKRSSEEELAKVKGIGREIAKKIKRESDKVSIRICPVCGAIVPEGATMCPRCGSPISPVEEVEKPEEKEKEVVSEEEEEGEIKIGDMVICPNCGALIPKGSKVCPVCGADLTNLKLEEPKPLEDPMDVLKRVFGVSELPKIEEREEEMKVRICPNCGAIVVNSDTCPVCGTKIPEEIEKVEEEEINLSEKLEICPNCGAFISPDAQFCPVCGAKLKEEEIEEVNLEEILSGVQTPEEKIPAEEIDESALDEIIHEVEPVVSGEEVSTKELEEIEKYVKEKIEKEKKIEKSEISEEKIVVPETPQPRYEEREIKLSFMDKLNNLFENMGTTEDLLVFSPLFISLIYLFSVGFLSYGSLDVFQSSVKLLMLSLVPFSGFEIYRTFKKFDFNGIFLGAAMCLIAGFIFLPYSLYFVTILSAIFIYLRKVDPHIPLTFYSLLFALEINYAIQITVIFTSIFTIYLIYRYEEINIVGGFTPIKSEHLYEEGIDAFNEKRYYDAIYLLKKVVEKNPNNINVLNYLGLAYGRIGNMEKAIETFQRIIRINSEYKYAWNNLGNIYARRGDYEKAINCYRRALKIDPNYGDALLNMGYIMIRTGNYNEAVRVAEKIKSEA